MIRHNNNKEINKTTTTTSMRLCNVHEDFENIFDRKRKCYVGRLIAILDGGFDFLVLLNEFLLHLAPDYLNVDKS